MKNESSSPAHLTLLKDVAADPVRAARSAGLRYVVDRGAGVRRVRTRSGFRYLGPTGTPLRDPKQLARIHKLAIPPAWTDVWICPHAGGHIQATGRDARGRKQYRYHVRWREVRDEAKYAHMVAFGHVLPRIRERVARDMSLPGVPRDKIVAVVVRLLEETLIRVGNEEYARSNASFGLTTFREEHVTVEGRRLHFHFRGKSGKVHAIDVTDPRVAAIVKRCQDLPGQELFHFRDDEGRLRRLESTDVNAYLRDVSGAHFTAKDFRTWHGTLLMARALTELTIESQRPTKRIVASAVAQVAGRLGNTPTVCRKNYVHPVVVNVYLDGRLRDYEALGLATDASEAALLELLRCA